MHEYVDEPAFHRPLQKAGDKAKQKIKVLHENKAVFDTTHIIRGEFIMKGRLICIALSFALVAVLTGCGNSITKDKKQDAKYYEEKLEFDKEEKKLGFDKEEEKLIEPLPELVNSEWYENKVQIYDMVFTNDGSMTDEDIRRIVASSEYDVVLGEGFDSKGNVIIKSISIDDNVVIFDRSYDPFYDIRKIVVDYEIDDLLYACTVGEDNYYIPVHFAHVR